ncbi:hypothetical protein P5673_010133 [Acropora cervicornis]|uniref:Negative elongation factor E n=1 Tax=Acropora cervicornis TaxID=6130 RepID=A0AAD9V947_ACRCE|nr:hypothetical protein P5673_010133 [Acropora cervicornis]
MGLPNLTPEEEYLLKKFAALKRKKKALQKAKEKTESPVVVKPGSKRDVPVDSSNAPEDAKEIAKKLIASGEVKIKKDPVHREFKRAKGGDRKIIKDFQQQPSSSSRNEQQSRAAAMKNLYDSQGSVTFDSCEAAENAISEMNGNMVSGVIIKVRLNRKQPNMGDSNFRPRPGLGSREDETADVLNFSPASLFAGAGMRSVSFGMLTPMKTDTRQILEAIAVVFNHEMKGNLFHMRTYKHSALWFVLTQVL